MYLLATLLAATSSFAAGPAFDYVSVNGCSGVLAAPEGRPADAPALVLTNGHCLDFRFLLGGNQSLPPPRMSYHGVSAPAFLGQISASVQSAGGRQPLHPARLIFASMDETDVAILELEQSYAELRLDYGVEASPLTFSRPGPGSAVTVRAGYFNRTFQCELGEPVGLREGSYRWPDALRLSPGCKIYPGVSGSPVIDERTGAVVALANTHYSGSDAPCSIHNPCEVDSTGTERVGPPEQSYGVSLAPFAGCFTALGQPDFLSAACRFHP